ncbi:MAG TPA: polysaccharide biosynthesis/export family protein [Blastocatellia bacterium]|nr:polysaccharide biosynthesis/export family protein [Blastocatellia bacterium]
MKNSTLRAQSEMPGSSRARAGLPALLVILTQFVVTGAYAQEGRPEQTGKVSGSSTASPVLVASPEEDYRMGPGDVIEVTIEDAPELSTGSKRINANGTFLMGYLGRIRAQGKTPEELEKIIADGLRGRYLKNPQVKVAVRQYNSRSFFIQGAVRIPGVYQIEGKPTLLKLITIAGGLHDNHGSMAFIIRESKDKAQGGDQVDEAGNTPATDKTSAEKKEADSGASSSRPRTINEAEEKTTQTASAEATEGAKYELIKASISGLLAGNFSQNVIVEPGDIVHIPIQDVFYVAGEVRAPGEFKLKTGTTLRQAMSLAQGTKVTAAQNRGVIVREDPATGKRQEIKVDIGAVMDGKQEDVVIAANDVIIVPNSRSKTVGSALLSAFGISAAQRGTYIVR